MKNLPIVLAAFIVLALAVTPVRSAPPPQDSSIQGILVGSLVAKRIPSAPANGQEIDTPLGPIVVEFNNHAKQAVITLFNGSARNIPYPPGFSTFEGRKPFGAAGVIDTDFTGLKLGQHVLALCGTADDSTPYGLVIDLTLNKFVIVTKLNDCSSSTDVSWSRSYRYLVFCGYFGCSPQSGEFYDANASKTITFAELMQQTGSWLPAWSPNWRYGVDNDEPIDRSCPNLLTVPGGGFGNSVVYAIDGATQARNPLFCAGWSNIDVEHWMDDNRAVLRGSESVDGVEDNQYFFVDFSTKKVISLGQVVKTGVVFTSDFSKLFMIKHGTQDENYYDCTLTMVDLSTLAPTDIEPDNCDERSDLTILDKVNKLAYLNSLFAAKDQPELTPYLHLVDLTTLAITKIPLPAINEIVGVSSDNHYLGVIFDDVHQSNGDATHFGGYEHPVIGILDLQQQNVVYSQPCLSSAPLYVDAFYPSIARDAFYFYGGTEAQPITYVANLSSPSETFSIPDALPPADLYFFYRQTSWSPDGKWLLIYTNAGIQLVSANNGNKRIPITTAIDLDSAHIDAQWHDKNTIELDLSDSRWLVTVPSL